MRRIWRWRLFIVGWIAGVYLCVLGFISVVNLKERESSIRGKPPSNSLQENITRKPPWDVAVYKGGRIHRLPWCKPLKWRSPPGPSTALVSFPGSGNTWLRYLLQQATGLVTGSVYKDYALLKNGFPAESVSNGSVLVVKTHEWGTTMRNSFKRVILMIRDPFDSILAEFNRQSGGHVGHASSEKFKRDHGRYWETFARSKAVAWLNTTLDWVQFKGPLHFVYYDNLVQNLENEMRKILDFLEISVPEQDFQCMLKQKDGIYRRSKKSLTFDPFTPSLKLLVNRCKEISDKTIKMYMKAAAPEEAVKRPVVSFIQKDKKL